MTEEILAELKRLNEYISELSMMVRVAAYPKVKETVLNEFANPQSDENASALKRQVYALSDGQRSTREIERLLGGRINFRTIAGYQQLWRKQGLATSTGAQGKTRVLFNLEDFGLKTELSKAKSEEELPEMEAVTTGE